MILKELAKYDPITIQCHDNPDADAIAAGYALCRYFESLGKHVRLVYGGRNKIQKPNLLLMLEHLEIPITHIEDAAAYIEEQPGGKLPGLLVTVDCQYGAGNVIRLPAEQVAVIDHHQIETAQPQFSTINPHVGSCSTLVWQMLCSAGYRIDDSRLGTALYYGLFTDTNQFAEIFNPLDMDMREAVPVEKTLITLFRNSNLSLQEMEVAGVAMIRHIYNDDYHYAIIKSKPCDPNILGLISDFLIQVAEVYCCVVYNETADGYKFSVRSCVKEVQADDLAAFLAEGVGSGGGLNDYFDHCQIIYAKKYEIDLTDMCPYVKKRIPIGYVEAKDVLPLGTPITIRTLEGDVDMVAEEDLIIMVGIKGEVYPNRRERFAKTYEATQRPYHECEDHSKCELLYEPTVHDRSTGEVMKLIDHAKVCIANGGGQIYAKELTERVKVFTAWDEEKYMLGKPGDYLAVRSDDKHDIYVVERDIFFKTYEEKKDE